MAPPIDATLDEAPKDLLVGRAEGLEGGSEPDADVGLADPGGGCVSSPSRLDQSIHESAVERNR